MKTFENFFGKREIILASESSRRRDLLAMIGLRFKVDPADVPERILPGTDPGQGAVEVARRKALRVTGRHTNAAVIAADTIVVLDGQILGKPANEPEAAEMLRSLSGRTHEVFTGFTVVFTLKVQVITGFERTAVTFRELGEDEISAYIATGNPMDKAGAYGIQDLSALFVERIEGCFYNVVGFPLARFYRSCRDFVEQNESYGRRVP